MYWYGGEGTPSGKLLLSTQGPRFNMKVVPMVSYGPPLTSDTKQVPTCPYLCSYDGIMKHALEKSDIIGENWNLSKNRRNNQFSPHFWWDNLGNHKFNINTKLEVNKIPRWLWPPHPHPHPWTLMGYPALTPGKVHPPPTFYVTMSTNYLVALYCIVCVFVHPLVGLVTTPPFFFWWDEG